MTDIGDLNESGEVNLREYLFSLYPANEGEKDGDMTFRTKVVEITEGNIEKYGLGFMFAEQSIVVVIDTGHDNYELNAHAFVQTLPVLKKYFNKKSFPKSGIAHIDMTMEVFKDATDISSFFQIFKSLQEELYVQLKAVHSGISAEHIRIARKLKSDTLRNMSNRYYIYRRG